MRQQRKVLSLVVSFAFVVGCGQESPAPDSTVESSALSIASLPAGEALVDGKAVGTTPIRNLSVEPGERRITIRREGFVDWTRTVAVESGETPSVTAQLVVKDATDPAALAVMAALLELEPVESESDETFRGGRAPKPVIPLYPRGDLRVSDIDEFRIDVTEEFEPNGRIEFRIGSDVVYSEKFDPDTFATTRGIPDDVAAKATPGKTVTWGYYPAKGKGKPVTTRFKVVKPSRKLEKRIEALNKRMEGQPELLQDQMRAQLLLSKRLYYAAYRDARSVMDRAETAPQSLTIMQSALRRMKLNGTALWTEIEEKVSRLPSRYRLRAHTR